MTKERLIESAEKLMQPGNQAAIHFEETHAVIAAELNNRMRGRPDVERLIGPDNIQMMENNSRNLCRFLASLFRHYEPNVLVETALWAVRTYRGHGFTIAYWPANLDTLAEILEERCDDQIYNELYPFINWLIIHIPLFIEIDDEINSVESQAVR
ncbi:hypothetical protein J2T58_001716 [Methanocalculus alkaliphilus]|uniref:hypothetical protein n=1 Tax=Methanocalculus alkaliphilus TaxID=768730 RepID=UPI00209E6F06|nr:hypothetical protein [Methanocalculus alkaliphilus]MCP1715845.1 hypothetical protein [Methanocalculus alkaliphilus]